MKTAAQKLFCGHVPGSLLSMGTPSRTSAVELYGDPIEEAMSAVPTTLASLLLREQNRALVARAGGRPRGEFVRGVYLRRRWPRRPDPSTRSAPPRQATRGSHPPLGGGASGGSLAGGAGVQDAQARCDRPLRCGPGPGRGHDYTNRRLRGDAKRALDARCEGGVRMRIQAYLGVVGTIERHEDGSRTVTATAGLPSPRYHVTLDDQSGLLCRTDLKLLMRRRCRLSPCLPYWSGACRAVCSGRAGAFSEEFDVGDVVS